MLDDEGRTIFELGVIIATRENKFHSRIINEYLIKWKNVSDEDASWEAEQLHQQHPSLPFI